MFVRKRMFAVSMAAVIAGAALSACGGSASNEVDKAQESEAQESTPVTEESDAATEESSEAAEEVEAPAEEEPSEEPEEVAEAAEDNSLELYNELLKKIVKDEEYLPGDGEVNSFSMCLNPGYALYDIDKDGISELFVTNEIGRDWRTADVYYVKDGEVVYAGHYNGYKPGDDLWIDGFDFLIDAYKYKSGEGFVRVWQIEYAGEFDETSKITYEGQESKAVSDGDINEIMADEVLEPEGIEWNPLKSDVDLTKGEAADTAAADTAVAELFSGDLTVESVTWNNGESDYDYSGEVDTEITFHMSDGTEQVMSTHYNPMITGMEMVDVDNDGNDEFVINAYFGNTAGDHEYVYAYELSGGQITQLFPTKDIPYLAGETPWPELTMGDLVDSKLVTVEKDGKTLNAIEVVEIVKDFEGDEIVTTENYHETIIYNGDHWEELKK